MSRKDGLIALAERVEALTGPDRGLDLAVILASGSHVLERRGRDRKEWLYKVGASNCNRLDPDCYSYGPFALPRFTASLDAAMSLVPEGAIFVVMRAVDGLIYASLDGERPICAATPALALTAAALRAIAETEGEQP
jgi:hypothetical protein